MGPPVTDFKLKALLALWTSVNRIQKHPLTGPLGKALHVTSEIVKEFWDIIPGAGIIHSQTSFQWFSGLSKPFSTNAVVNRQKQNSMVDSNKNLQRTTSSNGVMFVFWRSQRYHFSDNGDTYLIQRCAQSTCAVDLKCMQSGTPLVGWWVAASFANTLVC